MNELLRRLLNLPEQVSTVAPEIDHLHYFVIITTMVGAFGVFFVAFYFVIRYRQQGPKPALTPQIRGTATLEAGFISSILGLFLLIWIIGFRQFLKVDIPPDDAMNVYVVAKQWMWKFTYADGPSSVGVLYAPVNRPVKLLITSRDVIHSFYVPAFRVKKDAVPGRYTTIWFQATKVGTYPIECAEYCGTRHSMMMADVVVLSEEDFARWSKNPNGPIAAARPLESSPPELGTQPIFSKSDRTVLASRGEKAAADYGCLRCHSTDGTPHIGPTWTGLFGKKETLTSGATVLVDEAYLTESMMDPTAKIVAGFQPVMPSYQGRMQPGETAAIIEYIRTLKPNGPEAEHPNPLPVGGAIKP